MSYQSLSYLFLSSAAVLLVTAAEASAQTCTTAPSCSELGYTKSASQCSGKTMLYCPFDKTKVFCEDGSSCDSLGFTDIVSECPGSYVKCPTDATKGKCDFEASPGDLKYSLRTSDHNGWLLCNGRVYDKDKYPELYSAISGSFGSNLPNYSGYFLKAAAYSYASSFKTAQQAGLPNITGNISGIVVYSGAMSTRSGAFASTPVPSITKNATGNDTRGWWNDAGYVYFDASRSNSIYGRSSTVIPQNYSANVFIYAGRIKESSRAELSCEQGDFYNSDGTCTSSASGKTVVGLVFGFSSTSTESSITLITGGGATASSADAADQVCKASGGYLPYSSLGSYISLVNKNSSKIPTSSTGIYKTYTGRKYYNGTYGYYTCSTSSCSLQSSSTLLSNIYYYCVKTIKVAK